MVVGAEKEGGMVWGMIWYGTKYHTRWYQERRRETAKDMKQTPRRLARSLRIFGKSCTDKHIFLDKLLHLCSPWRHYSPSTKRSSVCSVVVFCKAARGMVVPLSTKEYDSDIMIRNFVNNGIWKLWTKEYRLASAHCEQKSTIRILWFGTS